MTLLSVLDILLVIVGGAGMIYQGLCIVMSLFAKPVRFLQEQAYNITRSDETGDADESQTVAIPKHVLDGVDRKPLRGTAEADGAQTEAGPQVADGSQSQGTDDNPRSRWR